MDFDCDHPGHSGKGLLLTKIDDKTIKIGNSLLHRCFAFEAIKATSTYRIGAGEGNSLEASLALDKSNSFSLGIGCHRNLKKKTFEVGVSLYVDDKGSVSPEVAQLRGVPFNTKKTMDVCINSLCKSYVWKDTGGMNCDHSSGSARCPLESSFSISIDETIRSLGIVVPNDRANYQFQGDVSGILKRICR